MKKNISLAFLNFFAFVLLFFLISAPIYFANNFSHIAGVKAETPYIIVTQISKFPNLKFSQNGDQFEIQFEKQGSNQVFLSPLVLNNPTNEPKVYRIQNKSKENQFFFGEDVNNLQLRINVPSQTSVPISLLSVSQENSRTATFQIVSD